jgi:hypothetical protein
MAYGPDLPSIFGQLQVFTLGQTRTSDNVRVTSVRLLIADSKRTFSYVRSGPKGDMLATSILRCLAAPK